MKLFETLNNKNFELYAAQNYYNPNCIDVEEFEEDIKRFKYLKRLITRYTETGVLSVNLILNHLIIIFNVFGYEAGLRMIEYKFKAEQFKFIKPFLIHLKVIENDKYTGIPMDKNVIEALRNI
jgi:hypothetical protein